jgi:hypothetical protein
MMFVSAKYAKDSISGEVVSIIAVSEDGKVWAVPLDPANTDYQNIMALVAAGELTIAPAE